MRIRSPRDFWAGLAFIAIAAAFIYMASGYRYGTAQRMGPGFFPIYVAGFLGLLGLVVFVALVRDRWTAHRQHRSAPVARHDRWR